MAEPQIELMDSQHDQLRAFLAERDADPLPLRYWGKRTYDGGMATEREERLARNEAMYRKVNERVKALAERASGNEVAIYFCECAKPNCRARVSLREADYERVRSDSRHFVIVPGHELPDLETVIEQNETWAIIEKAPEVTRTVEALDPRRHS
jgi:hypothetical protein